MKCCMCDEEAKGNISGSFYCLYHVGEITRGTTLPVGHILPILNTENDELEELIKIRKLLEVIAERLVERTVDVYVVNYGDW